MGKNLRFTRETLIDYLKLVSKGKVTSREAIAKILQKKYGADSVEFEPGGTVAYMLDAPYWRLVSERGHLIRNGSKESIIFQKWRLEGEGLTIVPVGKGEYAFKIENYKDYMYSFENT